MKVRIKVLATVQLVYTIMKLRMRVPVMVVSIMFL